MTLQDVKVRRAAPLRTPSNLSSNSVNLISAALTEMSADMFALYQNQEFPLACIRSAFSRRPSYAGRTRCSNSCDDRCDSRTGPQGRGNDDPLYRTYFPSPTSIGQRCRLRHSARHAGCSVTTISSLPPVCGRPTDCETKMATSPARA